MTTLAIRKRRGACAPDAASGGRAAALALALLALIGALAVLRVAPDLRAWWSAAPGSDDALLAHVFLFELNLPRVAAAVVAGGSLGIAGALFQSLTRNPLASPDLLGVTGGAQLGLLAAMLVPALAGVASVPLLFACGLLAAACAIAAAGGWRATPLRLVLAGSVCMLLFAALSTLVLAFFEQNIAGAALWANGSLYQPGASGLALAVRWLVAPLVALPFVIRPLNPLALGDDAAAAAGVRVDATRLAATVVAVAFTSVAVSIAGPLSYVGLVAPNLLRQVRGARAARLGVLVPLSALAGGALVLGTDSAVLAAGLDATLSTGVAIALVGTPLMLAMIRRGAAWSGVLHAQPERAAGGVATRLVGRLERLEGLGWPLRGALFAAAAAVVVAIVFAGVSAGPEWVTPARWWAALAGHDPVARMLIDLRMPRLLCALFAGALLAASGVAMQSVVRNPLAGPEVLGVTQGAGLVTLFALSTWPLAGQLTLAAAALTGGALSLAITLALNHRHRYAPLAVALTGIAIGALWTTLAQWLITQESVQPARFVVWLVGGTYGRSWGEVAMLLPWCALAVPVFAWLARPLDMLALGDDQAAALGLPVAALRPLALTIATLAACAAVAAVGPVGFVGLMAPHVATMLGARRHRTRLYVAAACGAVLLGAADLAARTLVAPREVPAGVLTALIGAPYLLGLLIVEGRRARRAAR
ncbi:Fe(3+)-hydroxamate ABC transporter permease FhuB [Burkholderia vietnamiensis]|uniref:Fe(3+)-hydroxamate ABC transporter permease FhuB n=2 Tax=Burkholderia vietnamiensis TaxID=60552 RepID=A0AAW7T0U3_BURVI|nr:Fe(3+)-hydroxamate ABC transporter permease FhuB [Burkholderia vietnamiensis]KKI36635.1 iron ABC transporter [Burkholderia vietnamiensis]MBR8356986.1 Fe(3+)-hydroxamate ABC transporter permease FhuB [Burkholderia vietnamiensis]MDN7796902.1 Fe(3+)-hydroxamate ABC transporter permease FhuB [Burkholderia vietnamiensis]HDR8989385.1 Fe(3+)-hydroxamate ABC transporter permease FhuB [Burkholderia vietnamiensis]HDR9188357.1 Fe(3+)-hydroxamate ABC transporter permease FhuB [Burkholderia vietnamiensi